MIYLDNAATTFPKPNSVYEAMDKMNRNGAVNSGRGAYKLAQQASAIITETKELIRKLTHADFHTPVVFSPSITVAMNQIIYGLGLRENATVYVSPYEHNAVARCLFELSKKQSLNIKKLPLNKELEIDIEKMKYEFSKDKPEVVFCTHISNVTGYILPVEDIFSIAKMYGAINVLDSAQSLGLLDVRVDLLDVDIIAFTAHKSIYGPFGIGGFINVSDIPLDVLIAGGTGSDSLSLDMPLDREKRYEAASNNIIAIAGLNVALKSLKRNVCLSKEKEITTHLIKELSKIEKVHVYEYKTDSQIGIVSFTIEGFNSDDIGTILDEDFGIAVRTGYHCAPYIHKYLADSSSMGTVRASVGQFTTLSDIDCFIDAIKDIAGGF